MLYENFEEFVAKCKAHQCMRKTFVNHKCLDGKKQMKCFDKYIRQLKKEYNKNQNTINQEQEFLKAVWKHYYNCEPIPRCYDWQKYCMIYRGLCSSAKDFVIERYGAQVKALPYLDVAHIEPRGRAKKKKHDVNNTVIIWRGFHQELDRSRHYLNGEPISYEERLEIFEEIREGHVKITN